MLKRNKLVLGAVITLILLAFLCLLFAFVPGFQGEVIHGERYVQALSGKYLPLEVMDGQYIRQIITKDSSTSRTIMWESTLEEPNTIVEYRELGKDDYQSVKANTRTFTDDKFTRHIHSVTIQGLKPDTKYEYRVGFGNKRSKWIPLTTSGSNDNFKAIIFPDSQSSDYSGWVKLAKSAYERNQDAQFFVNMGDLVDNGEDSNQWNAWFDAVAPIVEKIPVSTLMGNHETYGLKWQVRKPVAYNELFDLPKNGLPNYSDQFYSYDFNGVHFVVLDTQFNEEQDNPNLLNDEINWLKQDLSASTAKWKIVLMHKDVLQYAINGRTDRQPGFSKEGQEFMPIFDQYNVDAVLTAHLHTYRRRGHIKNFKRDASGPLYIITGVAGNVRYDNLWVRHDLDIFVAPQPEVDNYLTFEKNGNTLIFKAFNPDGTLLDESEITK